MDLGLKNQKVLITGGSKGIGLACARVFLAEGAQVALVSRSQENLNAAQLKNLMRKGILARIYMHLLSLENFARLLERKAARRQAA